MLSFPEALKTWLSGPDRSVRRLRAVIPCQANLIISWKRGRSFPHKRYWVAIERQGICTQADLALFQSARSQRRKAPRLVSCPCCGHVFDAKAKERQWKVKVVSLAASRRQSIQGNLD